MNADEHQQNRDRRDPVDAQGRLVPDEECRGKKSTVGNRRQYGIPDVTYARRPDVLTRFASAESATTTNVKPVSPPADEPVMT